MNIIDINDLPVIDIQISGRDGVATSALVINQEQKNSLVATDIAYTKDDNAIITLEDSDFIDSIGVDTSLSVIIYAGDIPLYRDIVKFTGNLDTETLYSQYDDTNDYYVYEDND